MAKRTEALSPVEQELVKLAYQRREADLALVNEAWSRSVGVILGSRGLSSGTFDSKDGRIVLVVDTIDPEPEVEMTTTPPELKLL